MIKLYLIDNYRQLFPELKGRPLTDRILADILLREGFEDPVILRTDKGKPYDRDERICFSVSHSGDLFGCALCKANIGLDIQDREPKDPDKIAGRFFTSDEIGQPFKRIWTRKEALIKYIGSTLSEVLSSESVIDRDDVDFIDQEIEKGVACCLCIPAGEDRQVQIIRQAAGD